MTAAGMNVAVGYSNELYDTIASFGLRRGAAILDIGCGTGIAAEPFAANGFPVTGVDVSAEALAWAKERMPAAAFVEGSAEALPFADGRFDVAVSAQAFHLFDRAKAVAEAYRVLRAGGTIAIWWKQLMAPDPLNDVRSEVSQIVGVPVPANGLTGGFREFYGSQFAEQTLRVLPWRTALPVDAYLAWERSSSTLPAASGSRAEQYFSLLEQRVRERSGGDTLTVAFVQYLYMAKKP